MVRKFLFEFSQRCFQAHILMILSALYHEPRFQNQ